MTDQLLTKCPHCGTTFRLTHEQLSIAGGAVRCGACYQVFHAKEHIVRTAVVEEILPPPPTPAPDPFKQADNGNEPNPYDSLDWDVNLEEHPDADLFAENYELPDMEQELEQELQNLGFEANEITPKPTKKGEASEDWAKELLAEMGEDEDEAIEDTIVPGKRRADTSKSIELSDSFLELDTSSKSADVFALDEDEEQTTPDSDEQWAKQLLEDIESEGKPKAPARHELAIEKDEPVKSPPNTRKPTEPEIDGGFGALLDNIDDEPLPKSKTSAPVKPVAKPTAPGADLIDNLRAKADNLEMDELPDLASMDELDSEAMETPADPKRKVIKGKIPSRDDQPLILDRPSMLGPIVRFLSWSTLNLALIATIGVQYAFFNLSTLAANEQYRPYLSLMCGYLGCTLPLQIDTDQIRVNKLVVRPHESASDALDIDAIIQNRASFEQPYPVIELTFRDINDKLVAGRRFAPRDYIKNPDIDLHRMPPDTSVRVSFEILNPGRHAVNYQMAFQPAVR